MAITIPITGKGQVWESEEQTGRIPARPAFESGWLINGQTVTMRSARTLEMSIQHRFGTINGHGGFDLFGLYSHANDIRMGLNYFLTDRIHLGVGATKGNLNYDLNWRWLILQQSRDDAIPVSVAYAGNSAISVRDAPDFYPELTNRFSYFHEVMVARRFAERFSLQLSGSFAHFNIVEEGYDNDNFSIAARSRIGITPVINALLEYQHPLLGFDEITPRANAGAGIEYVTRGHQFQVFVANYTSLMPQRNLIYHTSKISDLDFLIGFNIVRRWNL